jgi:eukaryotic-like serine/threonine-protein kinase
MQFTRTVAVSRAALAQTGSEEHRTFFQARLGTLGLCVFVLAGGTWLAPLAVRPLLPALSAQGASAPLAVGDLFHLSGALLSGALYLTMRWTRLDLKALSLLDVGVSLVSVALLTAAAVIQSDANAAPFIAMLAFTALSLARAIIVPSTAARTLSISLVVGGSVVALTVAGASWDAAGVSRVVSAVCWVAVAVVLSTLASRIIFGLRQQVQQARVLGQYTLHEQIGAGGMGEVWRASHALLRRPTAVKLIPPDRADPQLLRRFEQEVQLAARLTHPSAVTVYDYGRTLDGIFYYAMELVRGLDLERLVGAHGALPPARVIHVLEQVCGALAEAHDLGMVHRDVKPANILISPRAGEHEVAQIADFGLVKDIRASEQSAAVTAEHAVIGTPLYMSPEALRAPESVTPQSDLYSLGAVAWFLLVGRPPFLGESVIEVCSQHLHVPPAVPSVVLGRPLPADLETLVLRCLSKDPAERPRSARELRQALAACCTEPIWSIEDAERWWRASPNLPVPAPAALESTPNAPEPALPARHPS